MIKLDSKEVAISDAAAVKDAKDKASLHVSGASGNLSLVEPEGLKYLGYDFSCHSGQISALLPLSATLFPMDNAIVDAVNGGAYGDVNVIFPEATGIIQRFRGLWGKTLSGSVTFKNVAVADGGLHAHSNSGNILVSKVDAKCTDISYGDNDAAFTVKVDLGSIDILDATVYNCRTDIDGGAGLLNIQRFQSLATPGTNSLVNLSSDQGFIDINNLLAKDVTISSARGSIRGKGITVTDGKSDGPLKVISANGNIDLSAVDVGETGLIQIESVCGFFTFYVYFIGLIFLFKNNLMFTGGREYHLIHKEKWL
jgi:hypothetical protein